MLTQRVSASVFWACCLVLILVGCGLVGPAGPSVKVETIESGSRVASLPDSTTIQVRPGSVILESTVNYSQPNYQVEGLATVEGGLLKVDVETKEVGGTHLAEFWFHRYRLRITDVKPGGYRLRLFWHNRYNPPVGQFRDLADTLITVP